MKFIFLMLISLNAYSNITQYDVYGSEKKEYSWGEVCQAVFGSTSPLIDIANSKELICMSKKTSVVDFCKKNITKNLIRGFIDTKTKKVICQSGNRIVFKYNCVSNKTYCASTSACNEVQKDLAMTLDLVHSSITENNLNCYFSAKSEESTQVDLNSL